MTMLFVIAICLVLAGLGYLMDSKNKAVKGVSVVLFWVISSIPIIVFWLLVIAVVAWIISCLIGD